MSIQDLCLITFGSHLYGTNTPASDTDRKSVHIPDPRDILLQRVTPVVSTRTKADRHAKNTADDVDTENFSLHKFLALVVEGQTVALDMLFAPPPMILESSPIWEQIQAQRHRLLSRQCKSFLGYARTQANKYGIRGSRVAAARDGVALIDGLAAWADANHSMGRDEGPKPGYSAKMRDFDQTIRKHVIGKEHMAVVEIEQINGVMEPHLEICNRKAPWNITLKEARAMFQRIIDSYGHRALLAEKNEGVDWKALSHAVRVGRQAEELLDTGHITFPRPERERLLAIKLGQLDYREVATEIEELLESLERKSETSILPDQPDYGFLEEIVIQAYGASVSDMIEGRTS